MVHARLPSHLGRSALLVYGLALLAAAACSMLMVVARWQGGDYDLNVGAIVAGSACAVLSLWSTVLAFRAAWQGEALRWPVLVLVFWILELLVVRLFLLAVSRTLDVEWLPVIRFVPGTLYFTSLAAALAVFWQRTAREEPHSDAVRAAYAKPSRFAHAIPLLFLVSMAAVAFYIAPQPAVWVMSIERLTREAPAHYRGADPGTKRRLDERKISFGFVDKPLREALAELSAQAGVPIVVDARDEMILLTACINLRVNDMAVGQAVSWVAQLAGPEAVGRGGVIILSSRSGRLHLRDQLVRLPVRSGEPPWTLDETRSLCALGDSLEFAPWTNATQKGGQITIPEAGQLCVCTADDDLSVMAEHIANLDFMPENMGLPDECERRLDVKVTFTYATAPGDHSAGRPLYVSAALGCLRDKLRVPAEMIPPPTLREPDYVYDKALAAPVLKTIKDVPVRDIIAELLRRVEQEEGARRMVVPVRLDFVRHDQLDHQPLAPHARPMLLDLSPALKAGAERDALLAQLTGLLGEALLREDTSIIRDYWIARVDPWTAQRAVKLVKEAAQTGNVPPLPPAPWFFATFPKNERK